MSSASNTVVESPAPPGSNWRVPELGTEAGIRFVVVLATLFGRRVASGFLYFLSAYYVVTARRQRLASRSFLSKVGIAPTLANVHRHMWTFARLALDRFLFVTGRLGQFNVNLHHHELIGGETGRKPWGSRGAMLLGAHVGSFEAMRAVAARFLVPITVIVDSSNAQKIGRLLQKYSPDSGLRTLEVDPSNPAAILEARARVDAGEFIAILGDRCPKSERRTVCVPFLGQRARFPAGPYLLAHILRCPVFVVMGIFTEPNRYDIYCEPFAPVIELPRSSRDSCIVEQATRYAEFVERYVRRAPFNWANFFDFWATE